MPTEPANAAEPELTLVMPCLNEARTIEACIRKGRDALARHGVRGEIVVGDNGSTDGSPEIARRLGARVVAVAEPGYGAALMGAIATARGRYVIMADADDSYDWGGILPFLERLRAGDDLVMGNRFAGGIQPGAMPLINRYFGNPGLTALGRLFFRTPVRDFNCGMRGFSRAAVEKMGLRTTGMEFASEMVVKAALLGLRVSEVPVPLALDGRGRASHLRRWRDGWRNLRFMLLCSPRWLFLVPGVLLMLAGLSVMAWLLPGPRMVGRITFDVHTLLYGAMMVLMGYQSVLFALFTKIFAVSEGLLPPDPRLARAFKAVRLETGLLAGAGLTLLGVAGSVYAVWSWGRADFGPLRPAETLRTIIPALLALVLGIQTIFSSFFLSVLGLKRR